MKYLVFRFDVDTHKCATQGIPALLKLAKKHNVKFTFYVNFGRSISQLAFIKAKFSSPKEVDHHDNLSALHKLGLKDYLIAAILNPKISSVGRAAIKKLMQEGHELGLHGGRNHDLWNRQALTWSTKRIESELAWGIGQMLKIDPKYKKMQGFASPHWKSNNRIISVLKKLGFAYFSDFHTDKAVQTISRRNKLPNVPVNIAGEPGGVGYLEWCRARGLTTEEILNDFTSKLKKRKKLAVVYDHPYYSGIKEIQTLEQMIKIGKRLGFKITTADKIYKL